MVVADSHHPRVRAAYAQAHRDGACFITSSLILGELYTLLSARKEITASFWAFREKLLASDRIYVLHPSPTQLDAAFDLLRGRLDKAYSFVDATSFVLMREESVDTALTLDRHFAQEGFHVLPTGAEHVHEIPQSYLATTE